MLQKFLTTFYAIIFTLAVVFILPVAGEAADTPPASPVEKNNTGSWQTGPSSDLINSNISGRTFDVKDVKTTSKKVEPNNPEEFPMSEWKSPLSSDLLTQEDAVIAKPPESLNAVPMAKKDGNKPPADPNTKFPMSEWTPPDKGVLATIPSSGSESKNKRK